MDHPRSTTSMSQVVVRAYGVTDTGRRRRNNEDTFIIADLARLADPPIREKVLTLDASEDAILLAVSDGMGGADAGEVASAIVVDSLRRALREAHGDWGLSIKTAVERANADVWEAAKEPGRHGMGATLTALCVQGGLAHVAVVGDSRAYLLRSGTIRQMTKDQSFVQLLVDSGAIKEEEAETYAMKNIVLQAMGKKPGVEVAVGRLELRLGDRLLLCSDGLSNKVSPEDMLHVVDRAPTLPGACAELVALANGRGGDDNITVVVAELAGVGLDVPGAQESLTKTFQVLSEFKGLDLVGDPPEADEADEDDAGPPVVALALDDAPAADVTVDLPLAHSTDPPPPIPADDPAPAAAPKHGWLVAIVAVLLLLALAALILATRDT